MTVLWPAGCSICVELMPMSEDSIAIWVGSFVVNDLAFFLFLIMGGLLILARDGLRPATDIEPDVLVVSIFVLQSCTTLCKFSSAFYYVFYVFPSCSTKYCSTLSS